MKTLVFIALLAFAATVGHAMEDTDDELTCSIKTCAIQLLTLHDLSFSSLIKKFHTATFCIRECSPPAVHEFFQSVSYLITKRIPGICSGKSCIEHNRFVALSHCLQNRSWPLIQCSTKLVDLAELSLEPIPANTYKNRTCSILVETFQCFERNVEKCGPKPFSLVQETFSKASQMAVNFFCHVKYSHDGSIEEITAPSTESTASVPTRIPALFKPVAKGFKDSRHGSAVTTQVSVFTMLITLVISIFALRRW